MASCTPVQRAVPGSRALQQQQSDSGTWSRQPCSQPPLQAARLCTCSRCRRSRLRQQPKLRHGLRSSRGPQCTA